MAWSDLPTQPNILLLITDQQRHVRHWPPGWAEANLPALARLQRNGMTFERAYCAACECSPSRAAFVTSTYPQVNGVTTTAPPSYPNAPPQPYAGLDSSRPNLGSVLSAAGYETAWRGKWHLYARTNGPGNLTAYDFAGWDPPDAGTTLGLNLLGEGTPDTVYANANDPRYVNGAGGAVEFLTSWSQQAPEGRKPFFLVVSLVNPHDVHVYTQGYTTVGYTDVFESLDIGLPHNHHDTLKHKPRIQKIFRDKWDQQQPFDPKTGITPAGYAKFYAYLTTLADGRTCEVLDALDGLGLTDGTLVVRFGDHGEMGMSHGLREKMYNAYEETIRVPLVVSNPVAFPEPARTDAFASLVDLLPTLATIAGAQAPDGIAGVDLTPVLSGASPSAQDAVLWAYDDVAVAPSVIAVVATHIRAMRTGDWMYAVYFAENEPSVPFEFELYDLAGDHGELCNLLNPLQVSVEQWQALHDQLTSLMEAKGGLPPGVTWPTTVNPAMLDLPPLTLPLEHLMIGWTVPVEGK